MNTIKLNDAVLIEFAMRLYLRRVQMITSDGVGVVFFGDRPVLLDNKREFHMVGKYLKRKWWFGYRLCENSAIEQQQELC